MSGNKYTCLKLHTLAQKLWRSGGACRPFAKTVQYVAQIFLGCFIGCEAEIDPTVQFVHNGLGFLFMTRLPLGREVLCVSR